MTYPNQGVSADLQHAAMSYDALTRPLLPGRCRCGNRVIVVRWEGWDNRLLWVDPETGEPCEHRSAS